MWHVYLLCTWPCSGVQTPYSSDGWCVLFSPWWALTMQGGRHKGWWRDGGHGGKRVDCVCVCLQVVFVLDYELCLCLLMNSGKDWLDQSFIGLEISKIMRDRRPDCGCGLWWSWEFLVLGSLGLVQSQSFFSLETGLPSTTEEWRDSFIIPGIILLLMFVVFAFFITNVCSVRFLRQQKFVLSAFFITNKFVVSTFFYYKCLYCPLFSLQKFVVCFSKMFSCPSLCVGTWGLEVRTSFLLLSFVCLEFYSLSFMTGRSWQKLWDCIWGIRIGLGHSGHCKYL